MGAKLIQDGAAVKFGWKKATENLGMLLAVTFVVLLAQIVLMLIASWMMSLHWTLGFLFYLVYLVAVYYLTFGFVKILLNIVDGKEVSFQDLLVKDFGHLLNFFLTCLLYSVIVGVGFLLLVVPGILFGLKFLFAPLLAIDKGLGPIEALKESNRLTDGMKWDLIGFFNVVSLVIVIGYAALLVGVLLALPTAALAFIHVYRNLSNNAGSKVA